MVHTDPGTRGSHDRIAELDALRGVAALGVVLVHFLVHYNNIYGLEIGPPMPTAGVALTLLLSRLPVLLFFLISGFVIFMTLSRTQTASDFAAARFARLFPLYWTCVILSTLLLSSATFFDQSVSAHKFFANLTMVQVLFKVPNIDPVYWSLTYELVFYCLAALSFYCSDVARKHIVELLSVWITLAVCVWFFAPDAVNNNVFVTHLFNYSPFFVGGVGFFLWSQGRRDWKLIILLFASALIAGLKLPLGGVFWSFFLWVFFLMAISGYARWLRAPFLQYLGKISYALYLFHLAPGYLAIAVLQDAGAPWIVCVCVAIMLVIAIASALTFLIEQPAQRYLKKLWRGRGVKRLMAGNHSVGGHLNHASRR